jgi:acyl-CoA thioesterase-1
MNYRVWMLLWMAALAMPGAAHAASCTLLIVGDSLSSGYGLETGSSWVAKLDARLKKSAPDWRAVNASVSGDTTQNGLQRLPSALQRQHPQGVLIELGGNDALRGIPPTEIKRNLLAMIRLAKAAGAWVVLFDVPVLPNYGKPYADAIARIYAELARAEKLARIPCFVCGVGVSSALMQADGIHPNAAAQAQMLDAVWPHLQPKLRCPVKKP